jgi:hypothetical protein
MLIGMLIGNLLISYLGTGSRPSVTARPAKYNRIGAEQMDFSRPMTVLANGRTVLSGPQEVDWVELLETARRTYDLDRLVARRLRCKGGVKQ